MAENLIGNAARFARGRLEICLQTTCTSDESRLILTVSDDGAGFPPELLESGPKPFGRKEEDAVHFGMGLYSSQMLCVKHGGGLSLKNRADGGAVVTAVFGIGRCE